MNRRRSVFNNSNWLKWSLSLAIIGVALTPILGQAQALTTAMSPQSEAADRIAIQNLTDAYSRYADRRQAQQQVALFTPEAIVEIYEGEPGKNKPVAILHGHKELMDGFAGLKKYDVTMHFNGQSTLTLTGERASGETYCLAHHLWVESGKRTLMVMGIRYYDTFTRQADGWLFSERKLIIDWVDRRPSMP